MTERALVTGGGRGIGRAIATAFTARGMNVTILGRDEKTLADAVAQGVANAYAVADVTDAAGLGRAIDRTGPFDILVNNAGGASTAPFARTDNAALLSMFALNVESAFTATRACLPAMIEHGFGRVISIASVAGLKGYAYASAYVAAKHALVGLTRALAVEHARSGVTFNAICPGYTDTDLVAEGVRTIMQKTGRSAAQARAHFEASNSMGRLIRPEEVADAALWLSGSAAGAVSGQCIVVAGAEY